MDRDTLYFGGLMVFLVCLMGSRWVGERALLALDAQTRTRLIESFAKQRAFGVMPIIGLVIVTYVLTRATSLEPIGLLLLSIVLMAAMTLLTLALTFRKLLALSLPRGYLKSYLVARALTLAGTGIWVACLIMGALEPG